MTLLDALVLKHLEGNQQLFHVIFDSFPSHSQVLTITSHLFELFCAEQSYLAVTYI